MATTIGKIKVERQTDGELLGRFQEYGECNITWKELSKGKKIVPPRDTVAIVIDVPKDKGAVKVYEEASDHHLGSVGTEHAGFMVIVPWDGEWWFRVLGSLYVGYISVVQTAP